MNTKTLLVILAASVIAVSCVAKNQATEPETIYLQQNEQDMKKIIAAHLTLKPEMIGRFINDTKELIEKSRAEDGNISYTLYQNPSDSTEFIFFEEWVNQDAIDFHFATQHFQEFDKTMGDYVAMPPVIKIYDVASEE